MKVLNSVGSRMDLRGIVLVTGFHLDFELLTVTLWTGSSIQFVIYLTVHPSNQYCSNEVVGILWGTVAKALQESMYTTSIALCLFTDAVTPFYKAIRLVRHSLLLKKPCFLSLITLSTICLDTDSRRICFIILGTVVPRVLLFKKEYNTSFPPASVASSDYHEIVMSEKVPFLGTTKYCCFLAKKVMFHMQRSRLSLVIF